MTFVTIPLIANLFLLAILAIGRREVHDPNLAYFCSEDMLKGWAADKT
jgi:hypothetical protein